LPGRIWWRLTSKNRVYDSAREGKYNYAELSFFLASCGGGGGLPPDDDDRPLPPDNTTLERLDVRDLDQLYAYRADSPHADVLKDCLVIDSWNDACTLDTLPFLVQEYDSGGIEEIMSRVVVTHDWMGQRFEEYLNNAHPIIIDYLQFVTAVRIGSTVRPSNYSRGTGAISIDPVYLWQTLEEKQTVSIDDDPRADNGRDLIYWSWTQWRINGERAYPSFDLEDFETRTFDDLRIRLDRLMYHELAHAFDYLPGRGAAAALDTTLQPNDALWEIYNSRLSVQLNNDMPLTSNLMWDLSDVLYSGDEATDEQKSTDAYTVGAAMAGEGATSHYSYSTIREDFATLFESVMMDIQYGAVNYVAVMTKPENLDNYTCDDLTVTWGSRKRVGDANVSPRAKYVMRQMLNDFGYNVAVQHIDAAELLTDDMTVGESWCTNRDARLPAVLASAPRAKLSTEAQRAAEQSELQNYYKEMMRDLHH